MFYPLHRFRKHFKRIMFGDKFWVGKNPIKSRFPEIFGSLKGKSLGYENEALSIRETARSILADCYKIAIDEKQSALDADLHPRKSIEEEIDILLNSFNVSGA
jgi:hypothetical protein